MENNVYPIIPKIMFKFNVNSECSQEDTKYFITVEKKKNIPLQQVVCERNKVLFYY